MAGPFAFFGEMPWPATIEAWLTDLRSLRSGRSVDPLRLRRPIILRPRNILLLQWSNHHLLRPRLLVGQPWVLWGTSRRSNCTPCSLLLQVMKTEVFFHCNSIINQLIKILKTTAQARPKFWTHSFQEAFSLLCVRIHMVGRVTSQFIKSLDVLTNSPISLLQSHKLAKLDLHDT